MCLVTYILGEFDSHTLPSRANVELGQKAGALNEVCQLFGTATKPDWFLTMKQHRPEYWVLSSQVLPKVLLWEYLPWSFHCGPLNGSNEHPARVRSRSVCPVSLSQSPTLPPT